MDSDKKIIKAGGKPPVMRIEEIKEDKDELESND